MSQLTPMMAQYRQIKEKHQDCILMYRLGDFYEMFFEDALEASKILHIALTGRGKGDGKAPMCGVPFHAVNQYLTKLTKAGKKVAICDQMTAPDGKGIVQREVVRIVTPGTTFDENILERKANNYVAAVVFEKGKFALAFSDVTTGEFRVTELCEAKDLESEMMRIRPAECIYNEGDENLKKFLGRFEDLICFPHQYFGEPENELKKNFQIQSLAVFGLEKHEMAVSAAAMLMNYLKETQRAELKHIQKILFYKISEFMPLDEACIRNLELFFTNRDGKTEGSLIGVLDQTMTPMGGRMMRSWLMHPLLTKEKIEDRLNRIEVFVNDSKMLREARDVLKDIYDIERLVSRLSLGSGNARDLNALKESLKSIPRLREIVGEREGLNPLPELAEKIESAIVDEAPISVRDGGMIRDGFNSEIDELRKISVAGKTFLKDLQEREVKRSGINSLKVRFNKVFGYYIEISKVNLANVPADYIRKQTLVNAERFITPELKEYEEKVLTAEERIKELEYELFYQVRMEVVKEIVNLQKLAGAVATLDTLTNLAFVAGNNRYCKPKIVESGEIGISGGRHPVVEQMSLQKNFVPNDCVLNKDEKFQLITGPNMGGKSTYLRQVALIVLMAQIGSYVPAESAIIGVVDRIFTRVGASDNLVRGESTFMVEMHEASYILNNATEKSLIILDEIGRGTSTYDGVSIAWAIMEFIHDQIGAKTLFATHYHELIELADRLDRAVNLSVAVRENENEGVVFLYKVVNGGVDKSYGIEVAKLAGLPVEVVSRARGVLEELESKHIQKSRVSKDQIPMFETDGARKHAGLINELKGMDVNKMTPMEAIRRLDEIKKKLGAL
ncbi:MAG: DNA mismatch repair protein MutS [Candidatus Gracilibacteria bacterium]